jgi:hypothetical protein
MKKPKSSQIQEKKHKSPQIHKSIQNFFLFFWNWVLIFVGVEACPSKIKEDRPSMSEPSYSPQPSYSPLNTPRTPGFSLLESNNNNRYEEDDSPEDNRYEENDAVSPTDDEAKDSKVMCPRDKYPYHCLPLPKDNEKAEATTKEDAFAGPIGMACDISKIEQALDKKDCAMDAAEFFKERGVDLQEVRDILSFSKVTIQLYHAFCQAQKKIIVSTLPQGQAIDLKAPSKKKRPLDSKEGMSAEAKKQKKEDKIQKDLDSIKSQHTNLPLKYSIFKHLLKREDAEEFTKEDFTDENALPPTFEAFIEECELNGRLQLQLQKSKLNSSVDKKKEYKRLFKNKIETKKEDAKAKGAILEFTPFKEEFKEFAAKDLKVPIRTLWCAYKDCWGAITGTNIFP